MEFYMVKSLEEGRMTIECYHHDCKFHSNNHGGEGPFCDEEECRIQDYKERGGEEDGREEGSREEGSSIQD